jgi:hypothetical protein
MAEHVAAARTVRDTAAAVGQQVPAAAVAAAFMATHCYERAQRSGCTPSITLC